MAPTLVVTDQYRDVEKILVAFDGSAPAAKTLKSFVHLLPYGKDIEIELVNVSDGDSIEDMDRSSAILKQVENYLKDHNFSYVTKIVLEKGNHGDRILERRMMKNPDLLLMGAHSVSALRRATFGSTTHHIITKCQRPLFLSP